MWFSCRDIQSCIRVCRSTLRSSCRSRSITSPNYLSPLERSTRADVSRRRGIQVGGYHSKGQSSGPGPYTETAALWRSSPKTGARHAGLLPRLRWSTLAEQLTPPSLPVCHRRYRSQLNRKWVLSRRGRRRCPAPDSSRSHSLRTPRWRS